MSLSKTANRLPAQRPAKPHQFTQARITLLDDSDGSGHDVEVKNLDERGITFDHQTPLSGRRAIVVLDSPQLGRIAAEVDLTWCRFNRSGRYTSGGRFVQLVGKTA